MLTSEAGGAPEAEDRAPVIVWLRRDLRLADNPALHAAAATGRPVLPVFVLDERGDWAPGAASRIWLRGSLEALATDFAGLGAPLTLRRGASEAVLPALAAETGAAAIYWNRNWEPEGVARGKRVHDALPASCRSRAFNDRLLFLPESIRTRAGGPFRVFTPFWRACLRAPEPDPPLPAPARLQAPRAPVASLPLERLGLEAALDDGGGVQRAWFFGERAAQQALERFVADALGGYIDRRDLPGVTGTARLSPHLSFGEISARALWSRLQGLRAARGGALDAPVEAWLRQLLWREFAAHLLHREPGLSDAPMRPEFARFPWRETHEGLDRWRRGETGFPFIDAGLRELRQTGFMHNRARMVAASFLCKQMGVHWLVGARWFWERLVDADLANNSLGWQWCAGCGADAAPYFRIFNPVTQSRKFDPDGRYIRRWVPELAGLDDARIHAPGAVADYPAPMLDLAEARRAALARYAALRDGAALREDG